METEDHLIVLNGLTVKSDFFGSLPGVGKLICDHSQDEQLRMGWVQAGLPVSLDAD